MLHHSQTNIQFCALIVCARILYHITYQLYLLSDEFDHKPERCSISTKSRNRLPLSNLDLSLLQSHYPSIECGHHLCRQCRDHLLGTGKTECPTCREPNVLTNAVPNKHLQRIAESFKVFCLDYKERV